MSNQPVEYTFRRYGDVHNEQAESVEEALRALAWGNERGELSSYHSVIKTLDGVVLLEGESLRERVFQTWKELS